MIDELEDGVTKSEMTAWLDDVVAANPLVHPIFVLPHAIRMAQGLVQDGDEQDARRLVRLLNLALDDAVAVEDQRRITYYRSALLAANSMLANAGDEGDAASINGAAPLVNPSISDPASDPSDGMTEQFDGTPTREATIAWLDRINAEGGSDPITRTFILPVALEVGRFLEADGGERATRQLAGILTHSIRAATARDDMDLTKQLAGELLAVLSDIADCGDEDVAKGFNQSVQEVSIEIVDLARQFGRVRSAKRAA